MKSFVFSLLLIGAQALANDGGGSSTGGGHVRVCLKPEVAVKVKAIMKQSELSPQIASYPFENVSADDILSVDLLDLLEPPDIFQLAKPILAKVATQIKREKTYGTIDQDVITNNRPLKMMLGALSHMIKLVANSKGPEWASDSTALPSAVGAISGFSPWTASPTGLRITSDFDPRLTIADNCVFAQAVRQSAFTRHFATIDYDEKLVSKMDDNDLIVLALHEAMYSAVMMAPAYSKVTYPSVLTRRLTALALGIASGETGKYEPEFLEIVLRLGYGPFEYLVPADGVRKR